MSDASPLLAPASTCPHQGICSTLPPHVHFHAVASYSGLAALRAFTINHHNAGLAGLQHLSLDCDGAVRLHEQLSRRGVESVVLKTCNRTELYWRARVPGDDEAASAAFAEALGVRDSSLRRAVTTLAGEGAARHLFRVCCGIESLVLGEAEILGQVRMALDTSPGAGAFLRGVFTAALRTGRLARTETAIGAGAMSVASTGIQWLMSQLPVAERRVLIIGAGETGAKCARQLRSSGVGELVIANRTPARATALAATVGARATDLDALPLELAGADAVVCAAGAPTWLVALDDVRQAAKRQAPLVIVDLAMPSAVEPGEVPGVTRIDLQDLEHLVELHHQQRQAEVPGVEAVIARELQKLHAWARHEAMRPLVSGLRRKVEAIRRTELARAERELAGTGVQDTAVLDRLSRRLLDQILSIPLVQLEAGDLPLDVTHAEYLSRLFAISPPAEPAEPVAPVGPAL
jgi:glutamyl-tRNA reductase